VLEGSEAEVEERALPFREGEEVLVSIEEPHMYNEADAVAKLDGYMISVAGAGPLIGKRTLVRIDAVGRSAAEASLVEGAEVTDRVQRSPDDPGRRRERRAQAAPPRAPWRARPAQGRRVLGVGRAVRGLSPPEKPGVAP
jgi:ribonuclease G